MQNIEDAVEKILREEFNEDAIEAVKYIEYQSDSGGYYVGELQIVLKEGASVWLETLEKFATLGEDVYVTVMDNKPVIVIILRSL